MALGRKIKWILIKNNKDEIIKILTDGSNKAQNIANEVLTEIKKVIGINFKD